MLVKACVRSGFCCEKAPCGYGKWNEAKTACDYLANDKNGSQTSCLKYEEISKDPLSVFSPAFGYGCCMSMFNTKRDVIIKEHYDDIIPYINID